MATATMTTVPTFYRVRYVPGTAPALRYPGWTGWIREDWPGQAAEITLEMGGPGLVEVEEFAVKPVPAGYFSTNVLRKAAAGAHRVHPSIDPLLVEWTVTGSDGRTPYRVHLLGGSGYLTCTCPHGRYAGGHARCYHVAAVLAYAGLLDS